MFRRSGIQPSTIKHLNICFIATFSTMRKIRLNDVVFFIFVATCFAFAQKSLTSTYCRYRLHITVGSFRWCRKTARQEKTVLRKCPAGKCPFRAMFILGKCPLGKCVSGKHPFVKCPLGKMTVMKLINI